MRAWLVLPLTSNGLNFDKKKTKEKFESVSTYFIPKYTLFIKAHSNNVPNTFKRCPKWVMTYDLSGKSYNLVRPKRPTPRTLHTATSLKCALLCISRRARRLRVSNSKCIFRSSLNRVGCTEIMGRHARTRTQ